MLLGIPHDAPGQDQESHLFGGRSEHGRISPSRSFLTTPIHPFSLEASRSAGFEHSNIEEGGGVGIVDRVTPTSAT